MVYFVYTNLCCLFGVDLDGEFSFNRIHKSLIDRQCGVLVFCPWTIFVCFIVFVCSFWIKWRCYVVLLQVQWLFFSFHTCLIDFSHNKTLVSRQFTEQSFLLFFFENCSSSRINDFMDWNINYLRALSKFHCSHLFIYFEFSNLRIIASVDIYSHFHFPVKLRELPTLLLILFLRFVLTQHNKLCFCWPDVLWNICWPHAFIVLREIEVRSS